MSNDQFWATVKKYRALTDNKPPEAEKPMGVMDVAMATSNYTSKQFGEQWKRLCPNMSNDDLLRVFEQAMLTDKNLKDYLYGFYGEEQ